MQTPEFAEGWGRKNRQLVFGPLRSKILRGAAYRNSNVGVGGRLRLALLRRIALLRRPFPIVAPARRLARQGFALGGLLRGGLLCGGARALHAAVARGRARAQRVHLFLLPLRAEAAPFSSPANDALHDGRARSN
eukprot:731105-Pleurochrysis_carterae.AAC.5